MPDADSAAAEPIEFMNRYTALGIPAPPPSIVCKGLCEGVGVVPVYMAEGDHRSEGVGVVPVYMAEGDHRSDDGGALAIVSSEHEERWVTAWREAEAVEPADDGWHFVKCPDCGGTGIDGAPSDRNHYRGAQQFDGGER